MSAIKKSELATRVFDQDALNSCIQQVANILGENLELIDNFAEMFRKVEELEQFIDLYEAFNYELKLRCQEACNIIHIITKCPQNIQADTKQQEHEIPNIITNKSAQVIPVVESNIKQIDPVSYYDWILDIDYMSTMSSSGWKLHLNKTTELKGANVAVVGLYDKGKTHILNQLTKQNLPTGQKITTKGISFKNANIDNGTPIVVLDTAGSYAPENMLRIQEKEVVEQLTLDIVFDMADYFICVLNDFTSIDQRYLVKLARQLESSLKAFKEIIVVHNLRDVQSTNLLSHIWNNQITANLEGTEQKTNVDAFNPFTNMLEQKPVLWFKTQHTRHLCIVNDNSELGKSINPWTYSLLKYWLKVVVVPHNNILTTKDLLAICNAKVNNIYKKTIKLDIQSTYSEYEKRIIRKQEPNTPINSTLQLSTIINNEDDYFPQVDILEGHQYIILVDLPGMTIDEVEIYRQNVITLIRGYRKTYLCNSLDQYAKNERKCGHFELKFKIPNQYERRWSYYAMNNGVLAIIYDPDVDESPIVKKK